MGRAFTVRRLGVVVGSVAACLLAGPAGTATAATGPAAIFTVAGYRAPGTPSAYDHVSVLRYGSASARNVFVLVPGGSANAGYYGIIAPYIVQHVPNLQVWVMARREAALIDGSEFVAGLEGKLTPAQVFNYYLAGVGSTSPNAYHPIPYEPYFADWGLAVEMNDLHAVIDRARDGGRRHVVLGGHSLGGLSSDVYAAWDFGGRAGYLDIAGIVGIDGQVLGPTGAISSSSPVGAAATTKAQAESELANLAPGKDGPWIVLQKGLPAYVGPVFVEVAALAARLEPTAPSFLQQSGIVPPTINPPFPVTNRGFLGYLFDASSGLQGFAYQAIKVHSGHLNTADPRDWVDDGPTPIENVADIFSTQPYGADEWYFPSRLLIDAEAANSLTMTPAARYLGLRLTHRSQVDVPLYGIQTSLGGQGDGVIKGALAWKRLSHIPSVTLYNEAKQYSHLDPVLAAPAHNVFLQTIVPWLKRVLAHPVH